MKEYTISGLATVSCYTRVKANSKKEALEIAEERELSPLCHAPFSYSDDDSFHFENDGSPKDLEVTNID